MAEFSGRLSELVRFEGRDDVRNGAGETVGAWVLRFERWALVEPLSRADNSAVRADTLHSTRRWRVTLRDGMRPTLDMRMRWRGETLAISGIEIDPAQPGRIVTFGIDAGS